MGQPGGGGDAEGAGCGGLARLFLRVRDGRDVEIRFQAYGCGPTIAAASMARELYRGRLVGELCALDAAEIEQALDALPQDRRHAADVAAGALRAAAAQYQARQA